LTVKDIFEKAKHSKLLTEPHPKKVWETINDNTLFKKSPNQLAKLRLDLSRSALQFFKDHSDYYTQLYEQLEIDPNTAELEDIAKLCIPADMLRGDGQTPFLIKDAEQGGKHFTSSGTTGKTPVRVYRSPLDLAIMIVANTQLFEYVYGHELEQSKGIALFMAAEELKDMLNFVSFVDMTLEAKGIELIYGMDLVPGDGTIWKRLKPNRDKLIAFLKSKKEPKLFFTAPAGVHLLSDQFETMGLVKRLGMKLVAGAPPINLGKGGVVVTGGGSKGYDLPPYEQLVTRARNHFKAKGFDGAKTSTPFMDVLGMTETLTALIDHHGQMAKISHPLQQVFLLDPRTFQLTKNNRGILGVFTPYTTSWLEAFYPGDIMTRVPSQRFYGEEFVYERRLTTDEGWDLQRACGGTMEEMMRGAKP
jgi:hypothetical protein